MTVITATMHRPHRATFWVAVVSAAVLVTGLVVGLLLGFTGSSGGTSTPTTRPVVNTSNQGGSGGPSLCPGSVKDWSC